MSRDLTVRLPPVVHALHARPESTRTPTLGILVNSVIAARALSVSGLQCASTAAPELMLIQQEQPSARIVLEASSQQKALTPASVALQAPTVLMCRGTALIALPEPLAVM